MRLGVLSGCVVSGFTALALTGCGEADPGPQAAASWKEPAHYEYTVRSSCGERLLIGTFKLVVADGKVTQAARADAELVGLPENYPTLGDLLAEYNVAKENGAEVAELETDPVDGHPTRIDLDPSKNSVDDEACYVISHYAPKG